MWFIFNDIDRLDATIASMLKKIAFKNLYWHKFDNKLMLAAFCIS